MQQRCVARFSSTACVRKGIRRGRQGRQEAWSGRAAATCAESAILACGGRIWAWRRTATLAQRQPGSEHCLRPLALPSALLGPNRLRSMQCAARCLGAGLPQRVTACRSRPARAAVSAAGSARAALALLLLPARPLQPATAWPAPKFCVADARRPCRSAPSWERRRAPAGTATRPPPPAQPLAPSCPRAPAAARRSSPAGCARLREAATVAAARRAAAAQAAAAAAAAATAAARTRTRSSSTCSRWACWVAAPGENQCPCRALIFVICSAPPTA